MKYRTLCAALCLVLAALCPLTACRPGENPGGETNAASETAGTSAPEESAGGDMTLPAPDTSAPAYTAAEAETDAPAPEADARCAVFSIPGGLLDGRQTLTLSLPDGAPAGSYITYTTNGQEPTARGTRADKAVPLLSGSDAAVVRAAVWTEDGSLYGPIATHTYIKSGSTALRIVSLTVDPDDLNDKRTGILANRSGTGREWERPCSVEIIEPDGTVLVRQDAAVRLAGAGSRSFDPASFRITARKSEALDPDGIRYNGGGSFRAALFDGCDLAAYDKFLLRNGGNDALSQARSGFLRQTGCRDAIANNVCAALEGQGWQVFAQREVPAAVYLNGEFYAILNMKQDFDEDLLERQYGLDGSSVDILKGKKNGKEMWYKVESGPDACLDDWQSLCAYAVSHALAADYDDAYAYVAERLDIESAVQYYAVMTYLCNTDWPQNNVMLWRYDTAGAAAAAPTDCPYADGRWRFVIRDMDLCFALHDKASQTSSTTYSMADTDTFERILTFYWDGKGYRYDASTGLYADEMGMQGLFDFLLRSADFRARFRAAAEYLTSDAFASICNTEIDRYLALVQPEINAHIKAWQSAGTITSAYSAANWKNGKKDMQTFVRDRPACYLRYMDRAFAHYE